MSPFRTARCWLGRLSNRIGDRGRALLPWGFLDLVYGYSLMTPTPRVSASPLHQFLGQIMPIPAWALLWFGVGAVVLAGVFADHDYKPGLENTGSFWRSDWPAFMAASGLKIFFGTVIFLAWIVIDLERGYLSAAIWWAFALFLVSYLRRDTR